jgi:hypothetical protein
MEVLQDGIVLRACKLLASLYLQRGLLPSQLKLLVRVINLFDEH